jgi:hypothetical protein
MFRDQSRYIVRPDKPARRQPATKVAQKSSRALYRRLRVFTQGKAANITLLKIIALEIPERMETLAIKARRLIHN